MSKVISYDKTKLLKGINTVADVVKVTIGPRGKNVILERGVIANDGGTIAKEITLKDPEENMGANIIKDVIKKTSEDVGGGRTASAILTQALCNEGVKLVDKGVNTTLLKKGMDLAVKDICVKLDEMAKPVKGVKELTQVATISTESEELGKVIAETVHKIGKDGIVTVEDGNTFGITSELAEGLKFDKGYISPYMVTNERLEAEYKDIPVLITDKKLSFFKEVKPVLDKLKEKNQNSLVIIAEDVEGDALNALVFLKATNQFKILTIKAPGIGDMKKFCYEDLCALTGAQLWTDQQKDVKLGMIKKIISKKDSSVILGKGDIKTWITTLKTRQELADGKWEKDQYLERIAKLQNGIAVIKVGANSETEVKYLKLKIEDGVNETKRALEEGIVVGGDCAYIHARKTTGDEWTKMFVNMPEDVKNGWNLVYKAVESPLTQIVLNSNDSPDIVRSKVMFSKDLNAGYNALTRVVVDDMYKEGIIDAVKVVKTVLQNAVSASAMFLSIEAIISEEIKQDA